MVDLVRRITGEKTVGHAGTLDPFAEGVLLILVGREMTRRQKEFMAMPKTYVATLHLGATSDTDDVMGKIMEHETWNMKHVIPAEAEIQDVLKTFIGDIEQIPPIHSAIKLQGKKAYELARRGQTPKLKPRTVHIENIKLPHYAWPQLEIEVDCGSGTYIRALARDIGEKFGCGAYVEKLIRTRVGMYQVEDAVKPESLENSFTLYQP